MSTLTHQCPTCALPYTPHDTCCAGCGLIFASAAHPQSAITAMSLQPGQMIEDGRYLIERKLARGGMGVLYLASDLRVWRRNVVIKTLPSDRSTTLQEGQALALQLEHEAERLAALHHPLFPRIISYGRGTHGSYLVMEYIAGDNLLQRLSRTDPISGNAVSGQPYDQADVIRWGIALCDALIYLATQPSAVIHGDIKPENLILTPTTHAPYLVDFGAAALIGSGSSAQHLTGPYGTPGYAAPEQYGGAAEARSDVYSLAATLYHLATDDDPTAHPFQFLKLDQLGALGTILRPALEHDSAARPSAAVLRQHLVTLATPGQMPGIVAPDGSAIDDLAQLAAWCERHWARAADWLYSTLPDLIEQWQHPELGARLRSIADRVFDRNAGLDAALAVLDQAGFAEAAPHITASTRRVEAGTIRTALPSPLTVTIANRGRRYVHGTFKAPRYISIAPGELALKPGEQQQIAVSLDPVLVGLGGRKRAAIAIEAAGRALTEIEIHARIAHRVVGIRQTQRWGAWGTTIGLVLLLAASLSWTYAADDSTAHNVIPPVGEYLNRDCLRRYVQRSSVVLNRDATLAAVRTEHGYGIDVWSVADQAAVRTISDLPSAVTALAWSPDGTTLAVGDEDGVIRIWQPMFDHRVRSLEGDGAVVGLDWSFDGTDLLSANRHGNVRIWDLATDDTRRAVSRSRYDLISASPTDAVFAQSGEEGIVIWRQAETPIRVFATSWWAECLVPVAWSPDGQTIAMLSDESLAVWNPAGNTEVWRRSITDTTTRLLAFSPDGATIAVVRSDRITRLRATDGRFLGKLALKETEAATAIGFTADGALVVAYGSGDDVRFQQVAACASTEKALPSFCW